jgi:hypothetical protein
MALTEETLRTLGQTWPGPTLLGKSKPLALELDRRDSADSVTYDVVCET